MAGHSEHLPVLIYKMLMFVSVIIPTLNAESEIGGLLDALRGQTRQPDEVIVVDSASDDRTAEICAQYPEVRVISIARKDFDHGGTRDMALRASQGDIVLFLTQDAVPANADYIENLLKPFQDSQVAVVSGRQVARPNAWLMERYVREFNYPNESNVRSKADVARYGIKTFYTTDVCSAYRRTVYEAVGGFDRHIKASEDMFLAAAVIHAGWKVVYAADAQVIHSHNLSLREQYRRNHTVGWELENHKHILGNITENAEGMKLVKVVSLRLLRDGHILMFIHFGFDCCARLLGSKMGKRAARKNREKTNAGA